MPVPLPIFDPALAPIRDKVLAGERLLHAEGLVLSQTPDLFGLGALANHVRERRNGDKAFFNINRHINYSNVCVAGCEFCAFSRRPGEDGGWTHTLDEIFRKAAEECPPGCAELHVVGGLHPDLPFQYYLDMLAGLRARFPHLHLKAFSAVEIDHLARLSGLGVRDTIRRLKESGLGSLPGGGAEIFSEPLRQRICGHKADARAWLEVHRIAHEEELKSNATMLYGHLESWDERIDHLERLRALQDQTGGFQAFIPLPFQTENLRIQGLKGPSGLTDLRVMAVSRLLLDNFPHIKAYWVMLGLKTAQVALWFGADDLDGTVVEEAIGHMAGASTPQALTLADLERLIVEAGRRPVLRDTLYNEISRSSSRR
ncbi:MAG: aminofutalosine synthase MqnE [Candidatus Sumerlaeota bacterium]|nr:aminofutalosine synthase MqnE [Candidatus Sumerlaeota bacterium]